MLKYRGTGLIKAGFIGAVLIVLLILVGLVTRSDCVVGDRCPIPGGVFRSGRPRNG